MSNFFEKIGSRIKTHLDSSGLNQTDLADRLGISKQVVSKIIQGKKAINVEEIANIAKVLGVAVDDLVVLSTDDVETDAMYLLLGSIENGHTHEEIRFLNFVMDEMLDLEELLLENRVSF